ncbi:hypothetical protein DAPPUDRAFT_224629 [Daphnia pulex]|uniref:Reelin domain-containing protein n=1 Tax=Daphnia pulex TaxID=6669 RepID=E9GIV4_DAPPU|nr:hypothetical protein DAPPUDRAFT_224629 [Daphnia pulex]|eukprot:EFX80589.1 hypothetical protein DAPPUDRAFT_224629 [Daphnia pulex]
MFKYVCLSLSLFLLALNGNLVQGTPTGAPLIACADMTPQHGVPPQNSTSPFGTTPSSTSIAQGSTITLTLTGSGTFKGFLVIAFDNANQAAPIGVFSAVSSGQTLNCRTGPTPMNAATHIDNLDKTSVTMDWTAPAGFVGTVLIKTSFVQDVATFWVATESTLITVA